MRKKIVKIVDRLSLAEMKEEWVTESWLEKQRRAYINKLITYRDYDICVSLHYQAMEFFSPGQKSMLKPYKEGKHFIRVIPKGERE